jgi:DNA-binding LacI/PurR family transcriptional regulator
VNEELLQLSAKRYPLVVIDRYCKNVNSSFVATDNHNAMVEAIKFLHSNKFQHILYLTWPISLVTSVEERLNGYYEGLTKYYGTRDKANVLTIQYSSFEAIYQGVVSFLKANPNIDVIIAPGFQTATDAIIAAVNHLGLSIPNDIKLMIFDNDFSSTELKLIKPYAIEQDAYQIGYRSAAALYNQIYGDLRTETIRLPVNIIDYTEMQSIERQLT